MSSVWELYFNSEEQVYPNTGDAQLFITAISWGNSSTENISKGNSSEKLGRQNACGWLCWRQEKSNYCTEILVMAMKLAPAQGCFSWHRRKNVSEQIIGHWPTGLHSLLERHRYYFQLRHLFPPVMERRFFFFLNQLKQQHFRFIWCHHSAEDYFSSCYFFETQGLAVESFSYKVSLAFFLSFDQKDFAFHVLTVFLLLFKQTNSVN